MKKYYFPFFIIPVGALHHVPFVAYESNKQKEQRNNKQEEEINPKEYVAKIAITMGLSYGDTMRFLYGLLQSARGAFLATVLYNVAREFDEKYQNDISKESTVFIFDPSTSKINEVPVCREGKTLNFKYFAAFRTVEDARKALAIVRAVKKLVNG